LSPAANSGVLALLAVHDELRDCGQVDELFAAAAGVAPVACGFTRGLIASVADGRLSAAGSRPLADAESDRLRRALLADPVDLEPRTEESESVRHARRPAVRRRRGLLAERLGLEQHALAPIRPEGTTLALLILDRPGPPVTAQELEAVDIVAGLIAIALERTVLRRRIADLAVEVRQFAGTARALALEALDGTAELSGGRPPAGAPATILGTDDGPAAILTRLTATERRIAMLLSAGRSNRQIAAALVVSPETVKSHVGQILRKLGVANRVEAAALLLRAQG
jgi:DNA-binding CsgD family transcriptional regulator